LHRSIYRNALTTKKSKCNHNTGKGLNGISPCGDLTFISELYTGNTSDKQLTNDCGILKLLQPGDTVMPDRGFEIADMLHKLPWITGLEKSVSTFFMFKCFSRLVVRCFFSIQYQMFL
jgi:hypothetical protein